MSVFKNAAFDPRAFAMIEKVFADAIRAAEREAHNAAVEECYKIACLHSYSAASEIRARKKP